MASLYANRHKVIVTVFLTGVNKRIKGLKIQVEYFLVLKNKFLKSQSVSSSGAFKGEKKKVNERERIKQPQRIQPEAVILLSRGDIKKKPQKSLQILSGERV